jgi:hypothetical protein
MKMHHKEDSLGWEIIFRKSLVRGSNPGWKDTLPLMTKGDRFIRCKDKIAWRKSIEAWF